MNIKKTKVEILTSSEDMTPVHGYVDVDVPIEILWENFTHPNIWHCWNDCFFWVFNGELELGKQLIWCFQPIRRWYFYKMPAIAKIIELEPLQKVTWEVTILPGFYARHTYYMEDLGNGRTRFGSWEKATGWSFRLMKWFWIPHFVFVKDSSLEGTRLLEKTYLHHGVLHHSVLAKKSYWKFFAVLILLLLTLIGGSFAGWFYLSYVQQKAIELAPGVHAALGGGGNSLVVEDNNDVLLVDTKFPPGSETLQKWIAKNVKHPVTKIINTHYHYDHTQGNILYPDAQIFAQKNVPDLMRLRDNSWWKEHENGIPSEKNLIDQTSTLKVGNQEIILTYPGIAHTHGDLYVYLPKQNIVATGDLFFNTYYPFFDMAKGGVSIPKMILAIINIADKYPNAVFMPGHGSIANANDLRRYADYLVFLYQSVESAYRKSLSVDEAVKSIDLSQWNLNRLPSFHNGKLDWATAESNIRWVYEILKNS
jgi:glyoxylase-like metal-dependent hydrolase (beta-lactamase superfamily II)